jgi:hypothetical protein
LGAVEAKPKLSPSLVSSRFEIV